jgi:CheY-like chemotaxis protein
VRGEPITTRCLSAWRPAGQPPILVVDDNAEVRDALRALLERDGYRVLTAADGRDALERRFEQRPISDDSAVLLGNRRTSDEAGEGLESAASPLHVAGSLDDAGFAWIPWRRVYHHAATAAAVAFEELGGDCDRGLRRQPWRAAADRDGSPRMIRIRVTAEQKRVMMEAAERTGLDVSAWLRVLRLRKAGQKSGRQG